MTTFDNGPAKGQVLELRRAPIFLRVTKGGEFNVPAPGDKWDALDQVDDTPRPDETLYAYVLAGVPSRAFIRRTGGGGLVLMAAYKFIGIQPTQTVMRDRDLWSAWCLDNVERIPESVRDAFLG